VVVKPTSPLLRAEDLDTLIDKSPERPGERLVVDLSAVRYLSSPALAKLLKLKKKIVGAVGKLRIENPRPDLLEFFRITHLDQVLDIAP
jgi:anti-anti-sigma factor